MRFNNPENILITGGGRGLGRALALEYANEGVNIFICGRNEECLLLTKEECRKRGADVFYKVIDVTDTDKMREWVEGIINEYGLDLIIANAGISAGTSGNGEDEKQVRHIFDVNVNGVFNTILPVVPYFMDKRSGQIAAISSLAGFRGLPSCPAYSASKAAVRTYAEAIRGVLHSCNVGVTTICPGYIKTGMTDANNFRMPFLMSAEKAAKIIRKKLTSNPSRIAFPLRMYMPVLFLSSIPPGFTDWFFRRLPKK